jgi:transposase-like protein
MPKSRRRYRAAFKFKVAREAAKGSKTLNELASDFGLHPNPISTWKQELLDVGASLFRQPASKQHREHEALQTQLYEQIGRLNMELEGLKKKVAGFGDD